MPRDSVPGRRLRFRFDRAGWNKYRLQLVTSGVIRPPSEQVLEDLLRRKRRRLGRVQGHTNLQGDEYARRVEQAQAAVELFAGAMVPEPSAGAGPLIPSSPGSVPDLDVADVA